MRVSLGVVFMGLLAFQQAPAPVFRTATRLVQVNVVVHDKQGQPVADLTKDDFTVLERGKPQPITFFSVDTAGPAPAGAAGGAEAPLPAHTFTNAAAAHGEGATSVTVIAIDLLNTAPGEQMRARDGLLTFLRQIQPQDRIAIYAITSHGLALLHDYTSDSAALVELLRSAKPQVSTELRASIPDAAMQDDLRKAGLDDLAAAEQMAADFVMEGRIRTSLSALQAIAASLAGVPGRKNLVWVSSGFPLTMGFDEMPAVGTPIGAGHQQLFVQEMDTVARMLNNSGIAVYPVDVRGVFNPAMVDASSRTSPGRWNQMPSISASSAATSTMFVIADRTGGRVAYNTNDVGSAIRRAVDDGRVTYTLGYYPADTAEDGKWRDIKVTVSRPGADVRARRGYFAMRPADKNADARKGDIRGAVWSPVDATALPLTARVDLTGDTPKTVDVLVQLDAGSVAFRHEGDRWKAELDMAFVQKDAHGALLGEGGMDNLAIALTDENYRKVSQQGLLHRWRGPRQPSAVTFRVVVRDASTGSVGSVTVPFAKVGS
jgi:VWFA-related protein